jgi:hypothetical protein
VTALRLPEQTADLALRAGAAACTVLAAYVAVKTGAGIGFGLVVLAAFFTLCVLGFLVVPYWMVALMIPLFAFIPAAKVFVSPKIGPLKDIVILAAIVATAAILVLDRREERRRPAPDRWVLLAVALLLGLYVVNVGGGHGVAWAQGVRLMAEPFLLLVVGLTLDHASRTLRYGAVSLGLTAGIAAVYGLVQQAVGEWTLVGWGYTFSSQVRTYNGHLRSFGTFDDPFVYAAFLLFGLVVLLFLTRRGLLPLAAGALLLLGLAASYVRTAAVIVVALGGLWLARKGFGSSSVLVIAAAVAAMASILITSAGATQSQSYTSDTSTLTLNGRTSAWKAALGPASEWPFGRGVGKVGTAAYRAQFSLVAGPSVQPTTRAVDSGYLATLADVGLVGVGVLLALFGRLLVLAGRGIRRRSRAAWFAAGMLVVLMLDAVTRSSFTGFPTAFLGLLLVGVALAAADEEERGPATASAP